jgi:predicted PurR-regulated permease PerM
MESLTLRAWNKCYILLAVLLLGWLSHLLAPILTPFLIGALLAYLVDPLVTQLMRLHLPRLLSVIIIFSLLFLVITLLILFLVPVIQTQIENLFEALPKIMAWLQGTVIPWVSNQLGVHEPNAGTIKTALFDHFTKPGDTVEKFFNTLLRSGFILVERLIHLILIPVVTFYLLLDWKKIIKSVNNLIPRRIEPTVVKLIKECDAVLSAFFRGQLIVMLTMGVLYSIGLTLIGLRIGLILGLIIGVISIVPYLGIIIGIVAASVAAYVQFNTFSSVLLVWLVFIIGHMLEHMYLTPKLVGNRIGLHPVAVIFAILAGGKLFGFFGVLLALPAAAVIMVWLRFLMTHYHASHVYR